MKKLLVVLMVVSLSSCEKKIKPVGKLTSKMQLSESLYRSGEIQDSTTYIINKVEEDIHLLNTKTKKVEFFSYKNDVDIIAAPIVLVLFVLGIFIGVIIGLALA